MIRRQIAADERVFVSLLVLLETEWALRSRYALQTPEIMATISASLDATELQFKDEAANLIHLEGTAHLSLAMAISARTTVG